MSDFSPRQYLDEHYAEQAGTETGFSVTPVTFPNAPTEGSVWGASFRQNNIIASLANSNSLHPVEKPDPNFDYVANIPEGYQPFTDRFVKAKSKEQINDIRFQIDKELRDKAILGESPVSSFFTGFISNGLDPTILMPGSVYYKGAKAATSTAKAAMSVGAAAVASTAVQEAALFSTQEARTATEATLNIVGSAIIGSAMGAWGGRFINSKAGREAVEETSRVLETGEVGPPPLKSKAIIEANFERADEPGSVGAAKVLNDAFEYGPDGNAVLSEAKLKGEGLKFGEKAAKAMNVTIGMLTPLQRRLKSPFYWDKRIANDLIDHRMELWKNQSEYNYQGKQQPVEVAIGADLGRSDFIMTQYEQAYLAQKGIESGPFKVEKAKFTKQGLSFDEFDDAVWDTMITGPRHEVQQVNEMADLLTREIFEPWKDRMIEINELPPNVNVKTAKEYFMRVYNREKIMDPEQGAGFYTAVTNYINETNEAIKANQPQIKAFESKLKVADKLLKQAKKDAKELKESRKKLEAQEQALDARRPDLAGKNLSLLDKQLIDQQERLAKQLKTIEKNLFKNRKFTDNLEDFITQENERLQLFQKNIEKETQKRDTKTEKLNEKIKMLRELREERLSRAREQGKSMETKNNIRASIREQIEKAQLAIRENKAFYKDKIDAEKKKVKDERAFVSKAKKEYFEFKEKENKKLAEKYNSPLRKRIKELEAKEKAGGVERAQETVNLSNKAYREAFDHTWYNSSGKIRRVLKNDRQVQVAAQDTIDNVLALSDSRFDNPIMARLGIGSDPKTKPIKNRAFLIPDERIKPWLERSPRKIVPQYMRAVVPHYHLTKYARELGFDDKGEILGGLLKNRQEEFKARLAEAQKAGDSKLVASLTKEFKKGEKDIEAMVDILMGVYGHKTNIFGDNFRNFTKAALNINYIRQMGYMSIASVSDPAFIVIKNGMYKSLHHGLAPVLKGLEGAQFNKQFLKSMGRCIETFNGYRLSSFASTEGLPQASGVFGKTLDWMAKTFGNVTGMSQWNDLWQWIAGNTSIGRTLESIDKWSATGKMADSDRVRLANLGIPESEFKYVHAQFKKHGGVDENGAYWTDWTKWDTDTQAGLRAYEVMRNATMADIDSMIVIPKTGDKPLLAQSDMGKLLLQYKSFPFAATSRILVPALQRQERETAEGLMMGLVLGAMSYVITSSLKNKEIDYSFDNLAFEAIDRFGIMGIMMEAPLTLQKMGVLPGTGTSRYQSRDWVGALGGPTLGMLSDVTRAFNIIKDSVGGEQMTTRETNTLFKLFPWNNVWYIDGINRNLGLTDKLAISLGAKESNK